jgi:hypothetical protein
LFYLRGYRQVLLASPFWRAFLTSSIEAAVFSPHQQVYAGKVILIPHGMPWKRATTGYAPSAVQCPQVLPTIRAGATLSVNETSWLKVRQTNTVWALRDFLSRANISGLDTNTYIGAGTDANSLPNIGIAISGGGYRAMMNGAGAIAAFDNRTTNSTSQGQLGGILQASTYISGLSGGSWLVGSLYAQNFPSVQEVMTGVPNDPGTLWQFSNSILQGIRPHNKLHSLSYNFYSPSRVVHHSILR